MKQLKWIALMAVAAICATLTMTVPKANAQVAVEVGPAPDCPYGYYDYSPYSCAPYGYYGPDWFTDGVFVGAGPWFHGADGFRGHVDNHFDGQHGYKGHVPNRGDRPEPNNRVDRMPNFHGNELRDGRGHAVTGKR